MKTLFEYLQSEYEQFILESAGSKSKNVNKILNTLNKLKDDEPVIIFTYVPEKCLKDSSDSKIIRHYGRLKDIDDDFWSGDVENYKDDIIKALNTDNKLVNTDLLKNTEDKMIINNEIKDFSSKSLSSDENDSDDDDQNIQKEIDGDSKTKELHELMDKYPATIFIWGNIGLNKHSGSASIDGLSGEHVFAIFYNARASELLRNNIKNAEEADKLKEQQDEENKKAEEWSDDNKI